MSTAQPTVKQKGYAYSTADGANPRAEAVCGLIAIIAIAVFGAVGLFFLFLAAAFTNGVVLTGLTGSYAVFETVHLAWGELALEPIRTGDIEAQQEWIKFVNPLENGYNSMLTLCQIGISVWDYSYGILIFLVQLFFDIAVPIFKFVFATLGPYIMEFLLFRVEATRIFLQVVVQIFQALAVSLNGSEFEQDAIDTSGGGSAGPVGGDVGAVPGETVGGLPLNFINSFRKVSRFFLRGYTVIAFGIATILQALNVDVLTLITWFLNIFVKYMPLLMALGVGLSVSNAKGILEALWGKKSEFVRTPKYGGTRGLPGVSLEGQPAAPKRKRCFLPYIEFGMGLYMIFCAIWSVNQGYRSFLSAPFLVIFAFGFFYVSVMSFLSERSHRQAHAAAKAEAVAKAKA